MKLNRRILSIACLILLATSACSLPSYATATQTPSPKSRKTRTPEATPALMASPSPVFAASTIAASPAPAVAATVQPPPTTSPATDFCQDPQPRALIADLKKAVATSDGALLASLVSPTHGMDARFYRYGRLVNYDREHARFLFDSTFELDWGNAPGSGLPTIGSFHKLFVPALLDVLNKEYSLECNQLQLGGASYVASWPYPGIDYYSVYSAGTSGNGFLDWHTWLLGMHEVLNKPYLYAIMQLQWEP